MLASETVLQLARAVEGIRYGERRRRAREGLAKPVTAVEVAARPTARVRRWDPPRLRRTRAAARRDAAACRLARPRCSPRPRWRGRGARLVVGSGSARADGSGRSSIGFVSPDGQGRRRSSRSARSGVSRSLGSTLWFGNFEDKTLERIDVADATSSSIPSSASRTASAGMAVGSGAVWVVDGNGAGAAPDRSAVPDDRTRIPLPGEQGRDRLHGADRDAAVGAGSVWVAEANKVFRIDPEEPASSQTIDVPQADLLAFGDGALWVGQQQQLVDQRDRPGDQPGREEGQAARLGSVDSRWAAGSSGRRSLPTTRSGRSTRTDTSPRRSDVGHEPGGLAYSRRRASGSRRPDESAADRPAHGRDRRASRSPSTRPPLGRRRRACSVSTGPSPPTLPPLPADQVATLQPGRGLSRRHRSRARVARPLSRMQLEYATGAQLLNYPDAPAPKARSS